MPAPLPPNENERLAALRACGLLDTVPEPAYDDFVRLAALICRVPISAVSLIDADRQWFKASLGLSACQTGRDVAFCAHTILSPEKLLVVPDATLDPRFADNPLVTGEPHIRFYAGAPLVNREGFALGSLCVIDREPRTLNEGQLDALATLARHVIREIETRQLVVELAEQKAALDQHAIVAIADIPGHLTYVNDRFCAVFQYSRDSLLDAAAGVTSGNHPMRSVFAQAWATVSTGEVWRGEVQVEAADGGLHWIDTTVVPVKNAAGRPWQYMAIGTEVTTHHAATEAMRQHHSKTQALVDLVPAFIWFKDTRNNFLRANQRVADSLGRTVAEIEGRSAHEIYPEDADKFYADDLEVIRSGRPKLGIIEAIRDASGCEHWIQTDKVPYHDQTGQVAGIVVMSQDITEQRRAEEKLRLLSSAVEQCQESIIVTDAQLDPHGPRIVFVNAAYARMTGFTAEEALGRTPRMMQGPHTDRAVLRRLRQNLERGEGFEGETINYRKDGTAFDIEWQVAPIRNARGDITHFVAVQRDISARKAAELELSRTRETALESVRLKSRFLANMSHELRTPLNTINGLSATLVEQDLPPHARHAASLILQCGETLLENIQTILTHSSLEAGTVALQSKPFVLFEVVLKALRIAGDAATRKNVAVNYWLDPSTPAEFVGDSFRLQQILVNLLANAIKFTDQGTVYLRLRSQRLANGQWTLRFTIADTGIGISRESLGQLFKPFFQSDDSTTRRFEGTGLGLAITKSLVELMAGTVRVRSRPGKGSVFHFDITLVAGMGSRTVYEAPPAPTLAGKHLLLDAADPKRRQMIALVAKSLGIAVTTTGGNTSPSPRSSSGCNFAIRDLPVPDDAAAASPFSADPEPPTPVAWLAPARSVNRPAANSPFNSLPSLFGPEDIVGALKNLLTSKPGDRCDSIAAGECRPKLGDRVPLRILSADDVATNRSVLATLCEHLGYHTDLVENGAEVLDRVAHHPYDLIFLDVQMPVLDGISAAREICRRYPDPKQRPRLVAVTASVHPGDRERCLESGMDDYLSKPVLPKHITACIERLFLNPPFPEIVVAASIPLEPESSAPYVDRAHLFAMIEGLERKESIGILSDLYRAVEADLIALLPRIVEACRDRETQPLVSAVHGLKGCVLTLGWTRMGDHCAQTIAALREDRFAAWANLPEDLEALHRLSAEKFEEILSSMATETPPLSPSVLSTTSTAAR